MEDISKAKRKILKACALEYKQGMNSPVVKAFARGKSADALILLAKKHNIPIRENEGIELLESLEKISIDSSIPEELYFAIARIFAYLYKNNIEYEEKINEVE